MAGPNGPSSTKIAVAGKSSGRLKERFDGLNDNHGVAIDNLPDGSRIVVVSDMQIPFEDPDLLDTIFGPFTKFFKPKDPAAEYHLFLNGDVADLYNLSKWPAHVEPKFTLTDEVNWTKAYLRAWGKPFTHKHYVMGNHEERWNRNLMADNPKMGNFTLKFHEVLDLDSLGWDWVPYLKHYNVEGFVITHGDTTVKHAAAKMMETYKAPGTSGHVNRPQSFTWGDATDGEPITWYCTGMTCLYDIDDAIAIWRKIQPWQQGFLVGEVQGGVLHVQLIRVVKGGFWAAGKFFAVKQGE